AIELARRGYQVTGVDLSQGMLAEAAKAAEAAGVSIVWVHADATQYVPLPHFDAALCLCEGAFGLIGQDEDPVEHDLTLLRHIPTVLKPGGGFVLTALNALALIRQSTPEDVTSGKFDPITLVNQFEDEWSLPEGRKRVQVRERRYVPPELVWMLNQAGFE